MTSTGSSASAGASPPSSASVASSDHCRSSRTTSAAADRLERAPDRLEDRGSVAARRGLAELRQQQREVGAQRPEPVEAVRAGAQVGAQHGDQRTVGSDGAAAGRAAEDEDVRGGRHLPGEPRLADAGLTGEEQQGAVAFAGAGERVRQQRALGLTTEERAASVHGEEA